MRKYISITTVLVCSFMSIWGQTAAVFKSDGIGAETQGQHETAAKSFEAAVNAFKEQNIIDTISIYHAGVNYMRIDKFNNAIPFLEECIELSYNAGKASRLLSKAWFALKDVKKAEEVLLTGKEKYPDEELEFDKKLAYLYFNSGQYEKSTEVFGKVNTVVSGNKNYMYLYGFSLERIKKYDEAVVVFEEIQQLFPNDKKSKKMLGVSYFEQTDVLNEKEVKRYEQMKNAKLEDYIITKKKLERINKGYEKARVILEESLVDYPNDKMLINSLYTLYKKQFKEDKAAKMKSRLR